MTKSLFAALVLSLPSSASAQEDRIKALEDRISKLEAAPAATSRLSAFNPAMGMSIDTVFRNDTQDRANFLFRSAELNIEAPVDPFARAWAIINGHSTGVAIEEAVLQTKALPYNLRVSAGRLFASFGRLPHFHNHELPTVDRPRSIDTFVGAESQADGVEVSHLLKLPFYLSATVGAYNKIGSDNSRRTNADARTYDNFTYLGRLVTSADVGDDHSVEAGASCAWTPKRYMQETGGATNTRKNTWRALTGVDVTYRYHPAQGGLYKGVTWGTEYLVNNERRFDSNTNLPTDRVRAQGGYSYVQLKLGRHWRPGAMVDLAQDLDRRKTITRTYTAFVTYDVTEYQRLRLAWSITKNNAGGRGDNRVALQWTGLLGHHVHGFRDR